MKFILGYVKHKMMEKSIELFRKIKTPDHITATLLFNSCAKLGTIDRLDLAKEVWENLQKSIQLDIRVQNSFLDALIKCGDCSSAEIFFSKIKRSSIGYANLMSGFLKERKPGKVLNLFNQMKGDGVEVTISICLNIIKALSTIADCSISQAFVEQMPSSLLLDSRIQTALIDMWVRLNRFHLCTVIDSFKIILFREKQEKSTEQRRFFKKFGNQTQLHIVQ